MYEELVVCTHEEFKAYKEDPHGETFCTIHITTQRSTIIYHLSHYLHSYK